MRVFIALLFLLGSFTMAQDTNEVPLTLRQMRKQAANLMRQGEDWKAGERMLERILSVSNVTDEVDVDAANLARAHAEAEQGKWEESLATLEQIESFERPESRIQHGLLHGKSHLQRAEEHAATEEWEDAAKNTVGALKRFSDVLREDPDSQEAKHNLEQALKRLALYEQQQQQQEQQQQQQEQEQDEQENEEDQEQQDQQQDQQQGGEEGQDENQQQDQQQEPSEPEPTATPEPRQGDESEEPQEEQESSPQPAEAQEGEMTEEEAEQMLNALREQEEHLRRQRKEKLRTQQVPVEKNW